MLWQKKKRNKSKWSIITRRPDQTIALHKHTLSCSHAFRCLHVEAAQVFYGQVSDFFLKAAVMLKSRSRRSSCSRPWKAGTTSWLVGLLVLETAWIFFENCNQTLIIFFKRMNHNSGALHLQFQLSAANYIMLHLLLCKSPRPRNVVISMLVEPTPELMRNPSEPHGNAPGMWTKHKKCHEWDHCSTVPIL